MTEMKSSLTDSQNNRTYNAHETDRMLRIHGTPLASFKSRVAAFFVDLLLVFVVFMSNLILGAQCATLLGFDIGDVHLNFDFTHWYSLLFLVAYFTLWNYWTNGRTPGKWIFGIRSSPLPTNG